MPDWACSATRESIASPPPPPPSASSAGVTGGALTVGLPVAAIRDNTTDVPLRNPRRAPPTPPRVLATPAVMARPALVVTAGPPADTYLQGYVWRDAFPGDHICVTPEIRRQNAIDNARAAERRDPNGAYGPLTCIAGFVWRDARDGEAVCVFPDRRAQTKADNAAAAARRLR